MKHVKARKKFSFLIGIFCLQTGKLPEKGSDSSKDTQQAKGRAAGGSGDPAASEVLLPLTRSSLRNPLT